MGVEHRQAFADSILSWLQKAYGKMLYLPTYNLTIGATSVLKIVIKIGGVWLGCIGIPRGILGWKEHTYQGDGISTSPPFVLGWRLRLLGGGGDVWCYFRWCEGMSYKTSSHMCGSLYFPMFLLRNWSLTRIYMASLVVLVMPCAFLPMMVKQSHAGEVFHGLAMVVYVGGILRCSLSFSLKVLPNCPMYSS